MNGKTVAGIAAFNLADLKLKGFKVYEISGAMSAAEAKALLQHTDWSVADVAYGLGFEYPTYFNNYFKRVTGLTPKFFRTSKV